MITTRRAGRPLGAQSSTRSSCSPLSSAATSALPCLRILSVCPPHDYLLFGVTLSRIVDIGRLLLDGGL